MKALQRVSFFSLGSFVGAVLCVLGAGHALAQIEASPPSDSMSPQTPETPQTGLQPQATPAPTLKKRAVKSAPQGSRKQEKPAEKPLDEANARNGESPLDKMLLPDWSAPEADMFLSPVIGVSYAENSETKTSSLYMEGGIWGGLVGIPLAPGNPGVTIAPSAGYAIGNVTTKTEGLDADSGIYHRRWMGLEAPILVRFFKQTFGVNFGKITGEIEPTRQNLTWTSDSAVLILPFFSGHYTYTNSGLYARSFDEKILAIRDNWIHVRLFTKVFSAYVDFGPGVETQSVEVGDDTLEGSSSYVKGITGAELIPNLIVVEGRARYTYSVDDTTVNGVLPRMPTQDLGAPPQALGEPEDSFAANFFAGYKLNKFVALGYHYNLNIFNMTEKDGAKSERKESQGLGLHISGSL